MLQYNTGVLLVVLLVMFLVVKCTCCCCVVVCVFWSILEGKCRQTYEIDNLLTIVSRLCVWPNQLDVDFKLTMGSSSQFEAQID